MIKIKLDVKKIEKSALFLGEKGIYCDLTLMDNKDGVDQYGNSGFIVQDIGKQRREAGEKGPIVGNWKHAGQQQPKPAQAKPAPTVADDDDTSEIPF